MRRILFLLLIALVCWATAASAQGDSTEATGNTPYAGFIGYDFSDYGFFIDLPAAGVITNPGAPGWNETEDTVFVWEPTEASSVLRIDLIRQQFEGELSDDDVSTYMSVLVSEFRSTDGVSVLNEGRAYDDGLFGWNVVDLQHDLPEGYVYSSTYVTSDYDTIYAVTFYSLDPDTTAIEAVAAGVFNGFVPSVYADVLADPLEYNSELHGFSLLLPPTGFYETAATPGWAEAAEIEAVWYSTMSDPVSAIRVGVFQHDADYTREMVNEVIDTYINTMIGDSPESTSVLQDKENYEVGAHSWNYVEIVDSSDAAMPVHLTLYLTANGPRIYVLLATHFEPLGEPQQQFMWPVLDSLYVP